MKSNKLIIITISLVYVSTRTTHKNHWCISTKHSACIRIMTMITQTFRLLKLILPKLTITRDEGEKKREVELNSKNKMK